MEEQQRQEIKALEQRVRKYSIVDIVASAALLGMEYGQDYDDETAADLILCNDVSLVKRVLDNLENEKSK